MSTEGQGRPLPTPANEQFIKKIKDRILGSTEWATVLADIASSVSSAIQNALLTTRGDMIRRGASAPERFALGATDTVLGSDGTDAVWRTRATAGIAALNTENQALTGGVTVTSKDLGTITTGTLTLDMGDRPQQHYTNNGAHTLAPGSVNSSCLLDVTNGASAGATTTSGWTYVVGAFTTTNGHKFRCHASLGNAGSLLVIQELQ
jgi:hypothetical protein